VRTWVDSVLVRSLKVAHSFGEQELKLKENEDGVRDGTEREGVLQLMRIGKWSEMASLLTISTEETREEDWARTRSRTPPKSWVGCILVNELARKSVLLLIKERRVRPRKEEGEDSVMSGQLKSPTIITFWWVDRRQERMDRTDVRVVCEQR
jgi:hypothetical protein